MFSDKVHASIRRYSMLDSKDSILVAFSGGADSVALLHYLNREGYYPSALHVNHSIRGDESDGDEDFCRRFCADYGIPFRSVRVDVPAEAEKRGEGLEETARRLRYEAIEQIKSEGSFTKVATAHHADDNLETVIFNLTRGSGIKGGAGIPPVRDCFIRPLIDCTREEILRYCEDNSLGYVIDSTNFDTDYTRNHIRHNIVPLIKQINPDAASAFGRFSAAARRDNELLDSMVQGYPCDLSRQKLSELHDSLLIRFIYLRCDEFCVVPANRAVDQLVSAIRSGNEYKSVDMGKNLKAVCDRQRVKFIKDGTEDIFLEKRNLTVGENDLGPFGSIYIAETAEQALEFQNIYKISIYTRLNFDKIKDIPFVRSRCEGDKYRFANMTRSLKKLYNSKKLSVTERNSLPILCDNQGIIWIPGFPPCDRVKAEKNDKNILYIGYRRGNYDT